ncbi:MAG: two-component sensor histidine kinase, partial [Alphaproteobacteria bacterium]
MLFRVYVKRLLPRSLFGRSLLIIVLPLIILQVVSTYVFFDRYWQTVSRRLAEGLAGDVAAVVDSLRRLPGEENRALTFRAARYNMEILA